MRKSRQSRRKNLLRSVSQEHLDRKIFARLKTRETRSNKRENGASVRASHRRRRRRRTSDEKGRRESHERGLRRFVRFSSFFFRFSFLLIPPFLLHLLLLIITLLLLLVLPLLRLRPRLFRHSRSSPGTREIFVRIKAPGINIPRSREEVGCARGQAVGKGGEEEEEDEE